MASFKFFWYLNYYHFSFSYKSGVFRPIFNFVLILIRGYYFLMNNSILKLNYWKKLQKLIAPTNFSIVLNDCQLSFVYNSVVFRPIINFLLILIKGIYCLMKKTIPKAKFKKKNKKLLISIKIFCNSGCCNSVILIFVLSPVFINRFLYFFQFSSKYLIFRWDNLFQSQNLKRQKNYSLKFSVILDGYRFYFYSISCVYRPKLNFLSIIIKVFYILMRKFISKSKI